MECHFPQLKGTASVRLRGKREPRNTRISHVLVTNFLSHVMRINFFETSSKKDALLHTQVSGRAHTRTCIHILTGSLSLFTGLEAMHSYQHIKNTTQNKYPPNSPAFAKNLTDIYSLRGSNYLFSSAGWVRKGRWVSVGSVSSWQTTLQLPGIFEFKEKDIGTLSDTHETEGDPALSSPSSPALQTLAMPSPSGDVSAHVHLGVSGSPGVSLS